MSGEAKWFAEYWDKVIPVMEARLSEHGKKFIAGTDTPTIADFKCFAQVSRAHNINTATLVPSSTLIKLNKKIVGSAHYNRWFEAMKNEL